MGNLKQIELLETEEQRKERLMIRREKNGRPQETELGHSQNIVAR